MANNSNSQSYWAVKSDLEYLTGLQERYAYTLKNSDVFPQEKLITQQERIKKEWSKLSANIGGGRSMEKDLYEINVKYDQTLILLNDLADGLQMIFETILCYVDDLIKDNQITYLQTINNQIQFQKTLPLLQKLPFVDSIEKKMIPVLSKLNQKASL